MFQCIAAASRGMAVLLLPTMIGLLQQKDVKHGLLFNSRMCRNRLNMVYVGGWQELSGSATCTEVNI
jgi:hypothetical protein